MLFLTQLIKTRGLLIFILFDLSVAIDKISPFLLIKTLFSAGFHFSGTLIHLVPSVTSKFYFIFFSLCVHSLNVVCLRFGPLSYPPQWISCRHRILGYNFQISRLDLTWVPDSCFQLEWSRHLKFNIVLSIVIWIYHIWWKSCFLVSYCGWRKASSRSREKCWLPNIFSLVLTLILSAVYFCERIF